MLSNVLPLLAGLHEVIAGADATHRRERMYLGELWDWLKRMFGMRDELKANDPVLYEELQGNLSKEPPSFLRPPATDAASEQPSPMATQEEGFRTPLLKPIAATPLIHLGTPGLLPRATPVAGNAPDPGRTPRIMRMIADDEAIGPPIRASHPMDRSGPVVPS
jgi:hypothetical protein